MQKKLILKESDLTRIRTQREEFRSEMTEIRVKEGDKMKSLEQLKTLATSREDKIGALMSEIRRLKMRIAAAEGDAVTVDLLGTGEEEDIIKDLQARLKLVCSYSLRIHADPFK